VELEQGYTLPAEPLSREQELEYKLLQCKQLIAALVEAYGTSSEHGKYLDVTFETLDSTLVNCKVYSGSLPELRVLRLLRPLAQGSNGEAAPPTTSNSLQPGVCVR